MGIVFLQYLEGRFYCCKHCKAHLAHYDQIASMAFRTLKGEACLFHEVVNVFLGKKEDCLLLSGMHTVVDIHCVQCYNLLGWKYEHTEEATESFKIGKFLMERIHMLDADGNEYVGDDEDDQPFDDDDEEIYVIV